jgi:hypothetical protein
MTTMDPSVYVVLTEKYTIIWQQVECNFRHVVGFLQLLRFPPPMKLTSIHDIAEILLKVALNTITLANQIQLALE